MVVACLGHITRLLKHAPGVLVRVEFEGSRLTLADAAEDDHLVTEDGRLVMADSSGGRASLLNLLPANAILGVVLQLVDSIDAKTPHVVHGADLDVSAAMDVEVVVHNKGAVVRAPLGEGARHAHFGPVIWLVSAYSEVLIASALW